MMEARITLLRNFVIVRFLKESLDEILAENLPNMKPCLEAKLFGIGLEAYTVGSHDFYAGYCAKNNVIYTLDTGHYEPTENVSDAVSAFCFSSFPSSCFTFLVPCTGIPTM